MTNVTVTDVRITASSEAGQLASGIPLRGQTPADIEDFVRRLLWRPREDITAYEVAEAMLVFNGIFCGIREPEERWRFFDSLPDHERRHWQLSETVTAGEAQAEVGPAD